MESNPHKVPKGFFEEQRADILNAIKNETSNSSYAITISIFKTMLKAAASIGTIIFATFLIQEFTPENCKSFACILDKTDLQSLNETETIILDEWEYELYDEYEFTNQTQ